MEEGNMILVEKEKLNQILNIVESLRDMQQKRAAEELKLYTQEEAANILCVSESTLKNLRRDGKIEYIQRDKLVRFTHDQLKDYMEANTRRAFNSKSGGVYGRI